MNTKDISNKFASGLNRRFVNNINQKALLDIDYSRTEPEFGYGKLHDSVMRKDWGQKPVDVYMVDGKAMIKRSDTNPSVLTGERVNKLLTTSAVVGMAVGGAVAIALFPPAGLLAAAGALSVGATLGATAGGAAAITKIGLDVIAKGFKSIVNKVKGVAVGEYVEADYKALQKTGISKEDSLTLLRSLAEAKDNYASVNKRSFDSASSMAKSELSFG